LDLVVLPARQVEEEAVKGESTDARNQIAQGRERGSRATSIEDRGLQARGQQAARP
jgi:hypothetical protein